MRRQTVPPAISSTIGASPSTSELMAFAPIASPVSTITCTTTMVSPRGVSTRRTSTSRGPAPRRHRPGVSRAAAARSCARAAVRRSAAPAGSGTWTSWIWPIIAPASASATKPPPARATRAAFEAAAITDGSSTTMGTM